MICEGSHRPPSQYIVASGTSHCLIPNEYDRNIYAECNYVGNRTLIRCRQVRHKEDLLKNGGQCERHQTFANTLKRKFMKNKARLELEGTRKMKYKPVLRTTEMISDEEDYLMPVMEWISTSYKVDTVYQDSPEDDSLIPLRNAGVYTEKEVLRFRVALLEMEIEHLNTYSEACQEASRRAAENDLEPAKTKRKLIQLDGDALKQYAAGNVYQKSNTQESVRLMNMKKACEKGGTSLYGKRFSVSTCAFGREKETITQVVDETLKRMVSLVCGEDSMEKEANDHSKCTLPTLPGTDYCRNHISLSGRSFMFPTCDHQQCSNVVFSETDEHGRNMCPVHRNIPYEARNVIHLSLGSRMQADRNSGIQAHADLTLNSLKRPHSPFTSIDDSDDDVDDSVMDEASNRYSADGFAPRPSMSNRAAALLNGHFASPAGSAAGLVPSHLPPAVHAQLEKAKYKSRREAETQKSARCRPFNRENFPEKPEKLSARGGMVPRQPARPSIPFNPPSQRMASGLPPLSHQTSSSLCSSQYRSAPSPKLPQNRRSSIVSGFVPSSQSSQVPRVPTKEAFNQRKQMEEDQKAAASILDSADIDEELVEDEGSSAPATLKSAHPTAAHRYALPPPKRTQMRQMHRVRGPSQNVQLAVQPPQFKKSVDIARATPLYTARPVGRPNMSFSGRQMTVGAAASLGSSAGRPVVRRPTDTPPGIDFTALPPELHNKPVGDVLKGNLQAAQMRRRQDIVDVEPSVESSGYPGPPSSASHTQPPPSQDRQQVVESKQNNTPHHGPNFNLPMKQKIPSILRKNEATHWIGRAGEASPLSLPMPKGYGPAATAPSSTLTPGNLSSPRSIMGGNATRLAVTHTSAAGTAVSMPKTAPSLAPHRVMRPASQMPTAPSAPPVLLRPPKVKSPIVIPTERLTTPPMPVGSRGNEVEKSATVDNVAVPSSATTRSSATPLKNQAVEWVKPPLGSSPPKLVSMETGWVKPPTAARALVSPPKERRSEWVKPPHASPLPTMSAPDKKINEPPETESVAMPSSGTSGAAHLKPTAPKAEVEKKVARQGSRRSSRFNKSESIETETVMVKPELVSQDGLALLADVSARMGDSRLERKEAAPAEDDEEYEEEL